MRRFFVLCVNLTPNCIAFEAHLEIQQALLLTEFGQRVNMGEIKLNNVLSIESQRRGFLSQASFSASPVKKGHLGSPATKLIHYMIRSKHSIDRSEFIYTTNLPRRTVPASVEELKEQGLMIEDNG